MQRNRLIVAVVLLMGENGRRRVHVATVLPLALLTFEQRRRVSREPFPNGRVEFFSETSIGQHVEKEVRGEIRLLKNIEQNMSEPLDAPVGRALIQRCAEGLVEIKGKIEKKIENVQDNQHRREMFVSCSSTLIFSFENRRAHARDLLEIRRQTLMGGVCRLSID